MKKTLFISFAILLIFNMSMMAQSNQKKKKYSYRELQEIEKEYRRKETIRRAYRVPMEEAALQMTKQISNIISPQSGRNWHPTADIENMEYYKKENMVAAYVILRWDARNFLANINWGTCEVGGILYLYLPYRTIDSKKAFFEYYSANEHVKRLSNNDHWTQISKGLVVTME